MNIRLGGTNYKSLTVMVVDNGLGVELARLLVKDFKKVLYFCEWKQGGFPLMNQYYIGKGIPGVISVEDMFEFVDETDLFIFTDILQGDLQKYLEFKGKLVYGSRNGEILEMNRIKLKETLTQIGLPVGPHQNIQGLENLRLYLKSHPKQWIKINTFRGTTETFFAENAELIEPYLVDLENKIGPLKDVLFFIVEDELPKAIESGIDTYTVDGLIPKYVMSGIEVKNKCYLSKINEYNKLPKELTIVNNKLAPIFKQYGYKGWFSTEVRITEDYTPYLIDATCRSPWPPSNLIWLQYKNLADIYYQTASGVLVEPVYTEEYGCELEICSKWSKTNWTEITFPPQFRDNVKLYSLTMINNRYWIVPGFDVVGSVVATGKSLEEAIARCKYIAEQVKGIDIEIHDYTIEKALKRVEELNKLGLNIY